MTGNQSFDAVTFEAPAGGFVVQTGVDRGLSGLINFIPYETPAHDSLRQTHQLEP